MQQKLFFILIFSIVGSVMLTSFYSCSKKNISPNIDNRVTDVDGNNYNTIQIGGKIWMTQPLKTTRFNDSTLIPNVSDSLQWLGLNTSARCYYNNDSGTYSTSYGALYNWAAVHSEKLAPKGWHIADTTEWNKLIGTLNNNPNFTGGKDTTVGGYLKETGNIHWAVSNTGGATNSSGITALPGGYRSYLSVFESLKFNCFFWLSTEYNTTDAYFQNLNFNSTKINRFHVDKKTGYSVICVKN